MISRKQDVFEVATRENFYVRGYLRASPDLQKAFGDNEEAAARHLEEHGLQEGRKQVTRAFLENRPDRTKFLRFEKALPQLRCEGFPVNLATSLHQLSEYAEEPSNEMPAMWTAELENHPDNLYADIGAGLRRVVWANCAYVEIYPSLTADILIDADCRLPFGTASLDGIGCFAVLEHVKQPWKLASEFGRVVKPGGKIFIDWPFLQPMHGYPHNYYNATREGLRAIFADDFQIDVLRTEGWQGPDFTFYLLLRELVTGIKSETVRSQLLSMTVGELLQHVPPDDTWQTILGSLDDTGISILSSGNFLAGTRLHFSAHQRDSEGLASPARVAPSPATGRTICAAAAPPCAHEIVKPQNDPRNANRRGE